MKKIAFTFYNIGIRAYGIAIWLSSFFNNKATLWIKGRINIFQNISSNIKTLKKDRIWFHCASLGEFEQAKPVIERIKKSNPDISIIVSFFSPSGLEVSKNYKYADLITYLPLDTPGNTKRFIETIEPTIAIFVKYEFWLNYINVLHEKQIPLILISGIFRRNQIFFKTYGFLFRNALKKFNHLFVQDQSSLDLLSKHKVNTASIAKDTRFDRVTEISKQYFEDEIIENFKQGKILIVAGSTWDKDETLLNKVIFDKNQRNKAIKLIIAPHEVNRQRLDELKLIFKNSILYSKADAEESEEYDVLIIDQIGMLNKLYRYADIAYVGGGLNNGIHNILEAAVYSIPIIFGNKHQKFKEAIDLVKLGGAYPINTKTSLNKILNLFIMQHETLLRSSIACQNYVKRNIGGTSTILKFIYKIIHKAKNM